MLTCRDFISLVVDRLCDQAGGQNSAVRCFYLEFAVRKEQSATAMLGSLLKRIVSGMEVIPEDISQAFQEQKKAMGGWGPQLLEVVRMLETITSSQTTFVCIGALDECVEYLVSEVNENEPNTPIVLGSRLSVVTWVPDHGTYTSERYLDIGLMSKLPLCLTRRASVILKPLFQQNARW